MAISGSAYWPPPSATLQTIEKRSAADAGPELATSRQARTAAGASCRAERARPVTPARVGLDALLALDACAFEVSSHIGTGFVLSSWRTRSKAPTMAGSIPGIAAPPSRPTAKSMLLARLLTAAPDAELDSCWARDVLPSASAGELVDWPCAGASRASHCVMYICCSRAVAGAAIALSTRLSKPPSLTIAASSLPAAIIMTVVFSPSPRWSTANMEPVAPMSVASATMNGRRVSPDDVSTKTERWRRRDSRATAMPSSLVAKTFASMLNSGPYSRPPPRSAA
eukprot:scaffold36275_cov154-Isochrysis_galbana.AAC.16